MIHLTEQSKIMLAIDPVDFRQQIDGLVLRCKHYGYDSKTGIIFVFINRNKTMIRFLHHDGSGYWLATKRLSRGRFECWPKSQREKLSAVQASELMRLIKNEACHAKPICCKV